ncbi:parasitic phase-specific protein PSP-1 [Phaeosphaeria sp. MPI-PUGE-AT-0046c]|nr:parasitic phase-specific protein PSP-1 [Phaeosphaeria sp. MPI-PUGE-AT-0046c]
MSAPAPPILIPFGPNANCTLELCPVSWNVFGYLPSLAANGTFIGIFGLLLLVQLVQGTWFRTWGHTACVGAGSILQVIGYAGRIQLHSNPFSFNAFLMQIICITIAPVFYCAAVYVLLSQFIARTDISLSRFNPRLFYWIFIPADITCLVLQSVGGALSATGRTEADVDVGVNISIAGLSLQVVVLILFLAFFSDYLFALQRRKGLGSLAKNVRIFLVFLILTVVCILIRCIYRIVELKGGYFGPNFRQQDEFIGLEGAVMCVAVVCLILAHPGPAFRHTKEAASEEHPLE